MDGIAVQLIPCGATLNADNCRTAFYSSFCDKDVVGLIERTASPRRGIALLCFRKGLRRAPWARQLLVGGGLLFQTDQSALWRERCGLASWVKPQGGSVHHVARESSAGA